MGGWTDEEQSDIRLEQRGQRGGVPRASSDELGRATLVGAIDFTVGC